jgi:hypothetical protein
MNRKRTFGLILVALGLALVVAGAVAWTRASAETSRLRAQKVVLEDSLRSIRETAIENNLRHKALEMSIAQLPESVRVYGGGQIIQQSKEYSKKSHILEVQDRNVRLEMNAVERRAERARGRAVSTSTPLAAGGLVLLVAGLMVLRVSRARPEGA